jgi:hypothetical protein
MSCHEMGRLPARHDREMKHPRTAERRRQRRQVSDGLAGCKPASAVRGVAGYGARAHWR